VNLVKGVFNGTSSIQATKTVNEAITEYNSAIIDLNTSLGIHILAQGKEMRTSMDALTNNVAIGFQAMDGPMQMMAGSYI
jgi:hypothetical protein